MFSPSLKPFSITFVSFTLHEPITRSYNCVIEKGFSEGEKRDFPVLTVLVPISQCAKVTIVTEYVFHSMAPLSAYGFLNKKKFTLYYILTFVADYVSGK